MLYRIILISFISIISAKTLPKFPYNQAELDAKYWNDYSKVSLFDALNIRPNNNIAKNVILFLGDGMGISTLAPSRILKGQLQNKSGEEAKLVFEEFPYASLIKTYNVDYQVPDSAGTATAFLCGVKTSKGVLGITARVKPEELDCDIVQQNKVTSILKWALDSGKSAGIVSTARITHATPGAGYAHVSDRDWEANMPSNAQNTDVCKDIARQLIEDEPGQRFNVILGGGRQNFLPKSSTGSFKGDRNDGQDLIEKWLKIKSDQGLSEDQYKFVDTRQKLQSIDYEKTDYLFGLFSQSHMTYDQERNMGPDGEPSLADMTASAIRVLKRNQNGFVLLVEGGRIDHAHHDNYGVRSLYETIAFDHAIDTALKSNLISLEESLIVVTADHSHTFTMNGYPERGSSIFGLAGNEGRTSVPFTTLMYANGPGAQQNRTDPSTVDTDAFSYRNLAAVYLSSSNHGGEDVALFSIGAMAHLFHGTQEQAYIAHAMAYASCVGEYKNYDHCYKSIGNSAFVKNINHLLYLFSIFITAIILPVTLNKY